MRCSSTGAVEGQRTQSPPGQEPRATTDYCASNMASCPDLAPWTGPLLLSTSSTIRSFPILLFDIPSPHLPFVGVAFWSFIGRPEILPSFLEETNRQKTQKTQNKRISRLLTTLAYSSPSPSLPSSPCLRPSTSSPRAAPEAFTWTPARTLLSPRAGPYPRRQGHPVHHPGRLVFRSVGLGSPPCHLFSREPRSVTTGACWMSILRPPSAQLAMPRLRSSSPRPSTP